MKTNRKEPLGISSLLRIFHMVHGFAKLLAASALIRILSKLSVIGLSVTLAVMIERALGGESGSVAAWLFGALAALLAVVVLTYFDTYVSHDVSFRIVRQLQDRMYDHMDEIAPGGLEGIDSADSATVILSDINVFEWFVAHCLVEWIGTFTVLLICLLLICRISVPAALTVFFFLALMMAIPFFSAGEAREKGFRMKQLFGELNGIVADGVYGSKDVVAFHWTQPFFERLTKASENYTQTQKKYSLRSEREKTLEAAVECLAILSGLWTASAGMEDSLQLIPLFALCAGTAECIRESLSQSTNFGFVFGAASRILKIFDIPAPVADSGRLTAADVQKAAKVQVPAAAIQKAAKAQPPAAAIQKAAKAQVPAADIQKAAKAQAPAADVQKAATAQVPAAGAQTAAEKWTLTADGVKFHYRGEDSAPVLEDVSFQTSGSEILAVVAASGGGKSTLAKLLQRFWDIDAGSIRINGIDIRELSLDALRELVTVVPQETFLFQGSIRENLKLVRPQATEPELREAIRLAQAEAFTGKLENGLDTQIGENGTALSGGERQRLALAQAFLKNAPILVLDEATSALDTENERKVNQAIREHRRGKITIVIAHRLSSMKEADRILFLKDGRVFQTGSYQKLILECDAFRELVRGEYLGQEEK